MPSATTPFPSAATGDDMNPLLPAGTPEPHVVQPTLCARKVMVFPDTQPVPRPNVTGQPYVRLLARVNGLVQDLPAGMVLDTCLVPSGGGGTNVVLAPSQGAVTTRNSTAIPNQQVGAEDSPLMSVPTNGFKTITVDGQSVTVADYTGDVA